MENNKEIKILCIDDEKDNLDTIKDMLSPLGYSIDTETDSKKALKNIANNYYDIVITDIMMPEVSGLEITQKVMSTGRDTLVIVVTGFASVDTAVQSIQYGVYDYIQKPLNNIQNVIKKAVDYLLLQRKNYELGKRIKDTLSKVSLLHDISSILYQISDFHESSEMIIDTIIEGFKINQIGILVKQNGKPNFTVFKSKNIDRSITEKIVFDKSTLINNSKISTKEPTIINNLNGELNISNKKIVISKCANCMVLIPINFHINTLGYLLVFTCEDSFNYTEKDNVIELLEIFSNQIAPVLHTAIDKENTKSFSENYISSIIENKLKDAKNVLSPIAFALIRLNMLYTPHELNLLEDYLSSAKNIISKNFNGDGEIFWQNKDTGLLVFPAADLFTTERICIDLMEKIESLKLTGNKEKVITLKYACVNYPQSGSSSATLANLLWKYLFEELEKCKEKFIEV